MKQPFLTLSGDRNTFKLRMPDDDGIVVSGGDSGAELFAVAGLEVLFRRYEDICGGIEAQELRRPLFREVIRHDKERFLTKTKTF